MGCIQHTCPTNGGEGKGVTEGVHEDDGIVGLVSVMAAATEFEIPASRETKGESRVPFRFVN